MSTRTIGIDARELLGARTGVGRYLGELLQRWTARPDAGQRRLLLYTPAPLDIAWPGVEVRVLGGGRGTWWEQTTLSAAVRRDAPDVFFAPAYTAPLRLRAPLAVTIHDVSFSRHPEWFRVREGRRRHLLTWSAARRAVVVIAVSEFSRREIVSLYRVPESRVRVIRNGFTPMTAPAAPREPLVLYAGSIFNRRRVPDLIAAFARVAERVPAARLILVGANRTWPHEDLAAAARAAGVGQAVDWRDYVPDDKLRALYGRAAAFVFLSEYEGFGLTPLEALSAGVPILVADTPVAREIYGEAAIRVPVGDIAATAEALERLLTVPDAAAPQRAAVPDVLARYTWDASADDTLAAIEEAGGR